ncbi:hypothetical protein BLA29_014107, partial [Euroglyphus maynei]
FKENQILFQELTREIKTAKQLSQHSHHKQGHRKRNNRRLTGPKLQLLNRKETNKKSVENHKVDSRKVDKRPVRMQPRMAVFNVARNVKDDCVNKSNNQSTTNHVKVKNEEEFDDKEDRFFRKMIRKLNPKN